MKLQPQQRDIRLPKQWLHWAHQSFTPTTMAQFQVAVKKLLRAARALPPEGGFESHQID